MSSDFQRQSRQRKLVCTGLIITLFTATLIYRPYLLELHAARLALRQRDRGDVDVTAEAVRTSLTGSRGLVLCLLWMMAEEKRKRHQWDELELLIRSITQLEPHFISPWLFQSWNLAYNVPADLHREQDKYFYITRGIDLLAQGERQNRNHPDLRFHLGLYYLNKIGTSDEQEMFRTLFLLSCLDPRERNPANLRDREGRVDPGKFRSFCEANPHLVRRLREQHNRQTPREVVEFLAEHQDIPSRWETPLPGAPGPSRLRPPEKQFPILPRPEDLQRSRDEGYQPPFPYEYSALMVLPAEFSNNHAAQLWFIYSQEPLPPPPPVPSEPGGDHDRTRYRVPRAPALIIFRGYPAMAQTRLAEQLQREGWFDGGWEIDREQQGPSRWFPDPAVVGKRNWSAEAWNRAWQMWRKHGSTNGMYLDPDRLTKLEELAQAYRTKYRVRPQELDHKLRPEDFPEDLRPAFDAHSQLFWYHSHRQLTNFPHFYAQAEAESDPDAIAARALFFDARRQHRAAAPAARIRRGYEEAFSLWRAVLLRHPDYRRDLFAQEFTYRMQSRYVDLLIDRAGSDFRTVLALQEVLEKRQCDLKFVLLLGDHLRQAAFRPVGPSGWEPPVPLLLPGPLLTRPAGPFDGLTDDGEPFITPAAIERARRHVDPDERR